MLHGLTRTEPELSSLLLRLTLGGVMFPHGAQKLLGWYGGSGFSGTLQGMSGTGLPAAIVFLVIVGEFFGALGLIFGLLTRLCAVSIGLIMAGAMFLVHWQHGLFMNWSGQAAGEGFEFHLLAIGISLALLIKGGGAFSVDRLLARASGARR